MGYLTRLRDREARLGRPIRIALIGAGQMGRGFVAQVARIDGMAISVIAEPAPDRAENAYRAAGITGVVTGDDPDLLAAAVADGRPVITRSADLAISLPVDMVIDATGIPSVGADISYRALLAGRHVGTLNVECDVTVGHLLRSVAERAGLVYTVCRGDEPVEAKRLVDYARDLSFEVICAGKGKNNPLNPYAQPTELVAEARSKHMNPKMLTSFVDGSKAMIEMAALANGTGLEISKRGMNGPFCTVEGLSEVFSLSADGGILDRPGVIDYCTGPVAPGVFVVVRSDQPSVIAELEYLKLGAGPYFAFYRPYHLASIEAPLSVAEAVLDGAASLAPAAWQAEVVAAAKRDLAPGDRIDEIGGTAMFGIAADAGEAQRDGLAPLGLLPGARLARSVARGEFITIEDVEIDDSSTLFAMRRMQENLIPRGGAVAVGSGAATARG